MAVVAAVVAVADGKMVDAQSEILLGQHAASVDTSSVDGDEIPIGCVDVDTALVDENDALVADC